MSILDEIQHNDCWDCFHPTKSPNGIRLFGNENVGNVFFTNMQIPGNSGPISGTVVLRRWYARTALPETVRAAGRPDLIDHFEAASHTIMATLLIGNRVASWRLPLSELLRTRPDPRWPIIIPPRQDVRVQIDRGWLESSDVLESAFAVEPLRDTKPYVWVHLEGFWIPRSDKHVDKEHEEVVRAVTMAITAVQEERVSVVHDIAAWIMGESKAKDLDDTGRAMLQAIADGVLRRAGN